MPELAARSFVVSSFGKTYHCTGWKVGYCIAPPALSAEFRKVHQYLTFCTFQPAQWAFADVLERDPQHYLDLPRFYQAKRDRFRALLAAVEVQAAAGRRRVLPARRLLGDQRQGRPDVLRMADPRGRRRGDPGLGVLRDAAELAPDPLLLRQERRHAGRGGGAPMPAVTDRDSARYAGPGRDALARSGGQSRLLRRADRSAARAERPDRAAGNVHQRLLERSDPQRRNDGRAERRMAARAGGAARRRDHRQRAVARRRGQRARVYNRLLLVTPDGEVRHYDKRHLFRYAREHERYAAGGERMIVEWRGWRVCPLVCYDLRFPVFIAQPVRRAGARFDYDLLALRRQLAVAAALRLEHAVARARDREPELLRRREPRRHRRQRHLTTPATARCSISSASRWPSSAHRSRSSR